MNKLKFNTINVNASFQPYETLNKNKFSITSGSEGRNSQKLPKKHLLSPLVKCYIH
jgi:hypothetical protein